MGRNFIRHHSGISTATLPDKLEYPALDHKWRDIWESRKRKSDVWKKEDSRPSKYVLSMFPYPSGNLHMGHVRVYTISDVISRFYRMRGFNVLHPMGWDSFGLPAENAAMQRGIDPRVWTYSNINRMREQMRKMLVNFDWSQELATSSPEYYKHTQKLFIELFKAGLAYRAEAAVNWDPVDNTVLANEQVDANGRSWRSGAIVETRMLSQWFLRITDYAEELNADLKKLKDWPEFVKRMQSNWIGLSEGADITFKIDGVQGADVKSLTVFTTRPETILGVQYIALAPSHPIVSNSMAAADFVSNIASLPPDSKAGFRLPGVHAINPLSNKTIPVFTAPYVLDSYGHGAVMGVPAHDQRDFEFWAINMPGSKTLPVVHPPGGLVSDTECYTSKDGTMSSSTGSYSGMSSKDAAKAIVEDLASLGVGKPTKSLRLRDWLVSRQRYWGVPIPIVHCDSCGPVPVEESSLPILLPEHVPPAGEGSPLARDSQFLHATCPKCNSSARRDTDTMDTFVDSSWYFFRYPDAQNSTKPFDSKAVNGLLPVDLYIGGVEHAILHLLYSRFFSKFLAKAGFWDGGDLNAEPFRKLVTQGMVHGKTYTDPVTGRFLRPEEVDLSDSTSPKIIETGSKPNVSYEKMSKSKYNGVDPDYCISQYGADASRAHILFQAPVADVLEWEETRIVGVQRWLTKLWRAVRTVVRRGYSTKLIIPAHLSPAETDLISLVRETIAKTTVAFDSSLALNTTISNYTKLTNKLVDCLNDDSVSIGILSKATAALVKITAPVVPATAAECWQVLEGTDADVFESDTWPTVEDFPLHNLSKLVAHNVFINGRRRFSIDLDESWNEQAITTTILDSTQGRLWLKDRANGKTVQKVIIPKGKRTVSFVLK
ncbi:hypothetical protein V1511DRAFT_463419 [Dipodascopsis uninucleata]